MSLSADQLAAIRAFAVGIAREAGAATLPHFRRGVQVETKSDDSPVTVADREAEQFLRARISERFPEHAIVGEEYGSDGRESRGRWIVDPIDGTFSFIHGVPLYSNLVAFEWDGVAVVGVINLPAIEECVHAAQGQGCIWERAGDRRPACVSQVATLAEARLVTTTVKNTIAFERYDAYRRLLDACQHDRGWPDAYGYALVATGRAEIMLDPIMSLWDTAALFPVLTEAGGTLTDWRGNATHTAPEAIATNGLLLPETLRLVSK